MQIPLLLPPIILQDLADARPATKDDRREKKRQTRLRACKMFVAGDSVKDISSELDVSLAAVYYWRGKWVEEVGGPTLQDVVPKRERSARVLFASGASMKDIALALKTPLSTVYLWHRDWAATGAGALSAVSKIRETSSHELFKQGVSAKAVAERLKASLPTVYFWKRNWLAGGGIPGVLTSVAARRVGAHALFAQGVASKEVAQNQNIPLTTIFKWRRQWLKSLATERPVELAA